jgi:hypothetical protein
VKKDTRISVSEAIELRTALFATEWGDLFFDGRQTTMQALAVGIIREENADEKMRVALAFMGARTDYSLAQTRAREACAFSLLACLATDRKQIDSHIKTARSMARQAIAAVSQNP